MTSKDSSQHETEQGAELEREQDAATPLREAREAAGLSIDEVATQLNLGVATIEALEAGAYEQLPPPAFVRGYLRGYARLLQLDADLILDRYDARRPSEPTISRVSRVVSQPGSGHPLMRWATVLIVVALVGMAAIWWQREYREIVPVVSAPPVAPGAGERPAALPQTFQPPVTTLRTEEPASATSTTAGEDPAAANRVAEMQGEAPLGSAAADEAVTAEPTPDAVASRAAAEPAAQADAADGADGADAPAAEAQALAAGDVLMVQSRGESWMEVTDADGERLYFDLLRGGAPARLEGRAPFQIFLGNAPVVSLRINGVEVDKSGFTRSNNTARFVVERDGARRR